MDRDEIGDTMYRLGKYFPHYLGLLKSIVDSPFQEEIWQALENKEFKDIWDLIDYIEA